MKVIKIYISDDVDMRKWQALFSYLRGLGISFDLEESKH